MGGTAQRPAGDAVLVVRAIGYKGPKTPPGQRRDRQLALDPIRSTCRKWS